MSDKIKGLFKLCQDSKIPLTELLSNQFRDNIQPDWESFVSEADDEEWKLPNK